MADSDGMVVDKKKIACRLCRVIIAYSGNTSNMTYHLERLHISEFKKYLEKTGKTNSVNGSKLSEEDTVVDDEAEAQPESEQLTLNWKITDKVCGGISDNGSNIVNAFTLLNIDHFPCIAHTLQLAVNKGLKVARVQRIIARCKAIVSHFKRSTKETYKLREKQELLKLPQHMLVQDCVTRWGSTLSMLQRLIEQQTAISAVLVEGKDRHLMLESGDWEVVEMLVELLKPFQQATTVMGAVRYPTLSIVKPLLYKLLTKTLKITQGDSATSKAVKQEIKKDLDDSKREIVDMVEEELISLESDSTNQELRTEEVVDDDDLDPPVSKKKKGPISKLIGDLFEG
ncbi:E3 SUMO-protein ligase ZBED1-like [Dysidea avara]|uniref:E3 SUMO-protein ligase ZBED1-like n=1 Tax=Dysidea avara TaxID=196820 RepID=UPI0033186A29